MVLEKCLAIFKGDRTQKVFCVFGLLISLYFLVLSLVLIKHGFSDISQKTLTILHGAISPTNAFGFGWLFTLFTQSSAAASSTFTLLNISGAIGIATMVFAIIGTRIGTTITALIVSLFANVKRRDFRHGFEIGLANLVYATPVAIIMFLLEYLFGFFSKNSSYFLSSKIHFEFSLINTITDPVISTLSFVPKAVFVILGIAVLMLSLKGLPKFILGLFEAKDLIKKINKVMGSKKKSFLAGLMITLILLSTSITISLLIPLIISRIVNLKKVIPYIIGANLGGIADFVLSSLIIGEKAFPAMFVYVSFSLIGLFWLFYTDELFRITKFISKRTLHLSRRRAFLFVLGFVIFASFLAFI